MAGIRIITYVEDSIPLISTIIDENFVIDKKNSLDKSDDLGVDKVGYKSVHFVAQLPESRIKLTEYKKFKGLKFEIQVRTILQHSWAEIEHDRNYKFTGDLPPGIQRRFKLLAGLLELAENEFNNISKEIDNYSKIVKDKATKGDLDISINSTSLKEYLSQKISPVPETKISRILHESQEIVSELKDFGIKSLRDLDEIYPSDLNKIYNEIYVNSSFTGVLRDVMIITDYKKYFKNSYRGDWWFADDNSDFLIFNKYKITQEKIEEIINQEDQRQADQEMKHEQEIES